MQIRLLGQTIGAEVTGVDVRTLDDEGFTRIYRAWLDYNVICVRGQTLDEGEFLAYSRRFGPLQPHPSKNTRHPQHEEITLLGANKFDAEGKLNTTIYKRGSLGFHTDGAYNTEPFKATQLYALAIPSRGGDTLFASAYAAFEALPVRLKERLAGRYGVYVYGGRRAPSPLLSAEDHKAKKPAFHPLFRTHPETGRKSLYFDPVKILRIEGLEPAESDATIDELTSLMVQPGADYRHKWAKGDIVIWDNRCSFHKATGTIRPRKSASTGGFRSTRTRSASFTRSRHERARTRAACACSRCAARVDRGARARREHLSARRFRQAAARHRDDRRGQRHRPGDAADHGAAYPAPVAAGGDRQSPGRERRHRRQHRRGVGA